MHPASQSAIDRFADALWLEDGLAANSLEASFAPEEDKHRWMHELKQVFGRFTEQD